MAARSLWRAGAKLTLGATTLGGGAASAAILTSEDPATTFKLCTTAPSRLVRGSYTAAIMALDYEYSLWGLPEGSAEREKVTHEVHARCAHRLQELCFRNGGIYIKLGQHLGQLACLCGLNVGFEDELAAGGDVVYLFVLPPTGNSLKEDDWENHLGLSSFAAISEYLIPEEYVQTMSTSMLNRCPVSSYDRVSDVIKKELGGMPDEIFAEFDPVPLASASLAQVHSARTHDGKKVAVKVQHTHLTDTAPADIATVELIVKTLHRFFPSVDYRWLVCELRENIPKELDFLLEARNGEKCLDNFRKLSPRLADYVHAPAVYWNLSTSKLLTMEFIDGAQINDVKAIQRLGVQPSEVAKLVSQAFAEMMFRHGFVHCDPHAANMLVRPLPSSTKSILGKKKPQLVLLDHGLYKELDFSTRNNYAALWKALVFADADGIKENSAKLGAGEDLYTILAGILTMRPWNRVIDQAADHLVLQGNDSDRSELQIYASKYFPQVSELLRRLPREILLMLKTNDCLRAVNHALVKGTSLDSFLIIGKVSSEAVIEMKMSQTKSFLSALSVWVEELLLEARLFTMQMAIWLLQLRKALSG